MKAPDLAREVTPTLLEPLISLNMHKTSEFLP